MAKAVPDATVILVAGLDALLGHDPAGVVVLAGGGGRLRLEGRRAVYALLRHHAPASAVDLSRSGTILQWNKCYPS